MSRILSWTLTCYLEEGEVQVRNPHGLTPVYGLTSPCGRRHWDRDW